MTGERENENGLCLAEKEGDFEKVQTWGHKRLLKITF